MENNEKMKITITSIIIFVVVAILIIAGIIIVNSVNKANKQQELKDRIINYEQNQSNINRNSTTNTATNNIIANGNSTITKKQLLLEPITLFDKDNITVKVTNLEFKNSSWTGENLTVTFEMDNRTDKNLLFRVINIPKINGWSWSSFSRLSDKIVGANEKETFELSANTAGISNQKEENIKELIFDFTINTPGSSLQNIEEKVLYTLKDNQIKTGYYNGEIINTVKQNENVIANVYEISKLKVSATLAKEINSANLSLIMINDGYTSETAISNHGKFTGTDGKDKIKIQYEQYNGDLDYTWLGIKTIKINGIEIGNSFTSLYGEILKTVGNTASIQEINIDLQSETFARQGITSIEQIEISGIIYKNEMYENNVVIQTKIGEFNNVVIK